MPGVKWARIIRTPEVRRAWVLRAPARRT